MLWNCSTHNATLVLAGVPFSSFCLAWCRRTRGKRASTVFSCHSRDLIANYIILRTNLSEFCRCHPLASRHATTPAGKQAYLTVGGNTTSRRHISQRVDSLQEGQGAFLSRISSNSLPYSNSGRDGDEPTNGSLFFLPLPNHLVGFLQHIHHELIRTDRLPNEEDVPGLRLQQQHVVRPSPAGDVGPLRKDHVGSRCGLRPRLFSIHHDTIGVANFTGLFLLRSERLLAWEPYEKPLRDKQPFYVRVLAAEQHASEETNAATSLNTQSRMGILCRLC